MVVLCAPVFAQFDTAAVLGTVRDPSGAVIAGARITLRNVNTGVTVSGKTDAAGNYEFLTVKIGDYRVEADAAGFRPVTTDAFNVAVNARQRVDLKLEVGTAWTEGRDDAEDVLIRRVGSDERIPLPRKLIAACRDGAVARAISSSVMPPKSNKVSCSSSASCG